mgnify:CR=1 FL=1
MGETASRGRCSPRAPWTAGTPGRLLLGWPAGRPWSGLGLYYYRTSTRTTTKKIYYYRCLGSDDYRYEAGRVCANKPVRADYLDHVVWDHSTALLANPALIRAEIDNSDSDYDREKLQERLAKLAGGVAVIRVGGATEVEVKERKDRVDDALHATRAAVEEGIVPGGGVALLRAAAKLEKLEAANEDQKVGIRIVRKALEAPLRQIAENAGTDGSVVVGKVLEAKDAQWGYNAQTGAYTNLVKDGVIDPTKVVRIALQDASSIAGLLITTEAMVAEKPEKKAPAMPGGGGMGGMGDMDF